MNVRHLDLNRSVFVSFDKFLCDFICFKAQTRDSNIGIEIFDLWLTTNFRQRKCNHIGGTETSNLVEQNHWKSWDHQQLHQLICSSQVQPRDPTGLMAQDSKFHHQEESTGETKSNFFVNISRILPNNLICFFHKFPNPKMSSNKNVEVLNFWRHFLAHFYALWSILFWMLLLKILCRLKFQFQIGCWRISTSLSVVIRVNSEK